MKSSFKFVILLLLRFAILSGESYRHGVASQRPTRPGKIPSATLPNLGGQTDHCDVLSRRAHRTQVMAFGAPARRGSRTACMRAGTCDKGFGKSLNPSTREESCPKPKTAATEIASNKTARERYLERIARNPEVARHYERWASYVYQRRQVAVKHNRFSAPDHSGLNAAASQPCAAIACH